MAETRPGASFNGRIETMTETNGTAVSNATEVVAVKRGRKPGQLIWTHEKVVARMTNDTIIDRAKFDFLQTTYGPDLSALQIMILSDHSKVKEYWTESQDFKTATARVDAIREEQAAIKAASELKSATSSVSNETLMAALTPAQLEWRLAAAAAAHAAEVAE